MIHKISKLYLKKYCNELINYFEDNITKATKGNAGNNEINNLEISIDINNFNLGAALNFGIQNFKNKYPLINTHIKPWHTLKIAKLCRYEPNQYYSQIHCENDGSKECIKRLFGWMFFLNTIKKGGETEFLLQKYIAKPKEGDFYIWPAYWTHFHRGVNAPNERKYILTGWCEYE